MWSGVASFGNDAFSLSSPSLSAPLWHCHEQRTELSQRPLLESGGVGGGVLQTRRTIFIKNVPSTVDNGHNLMAFVPCEGLVTLRVRQTCGRNIGFVEYGTAEAACRALQWFCELQMTAEIAAGCLVHTPSTGAFVPTEFRYPVPYVEYNNCANDPNRSTELLLNSVILAAEWCTGSPTCRSEAPPSPPLVKLPFLHVMAKNHSVNAITGKPFLQYANANHQSTFSSVPVVFMDSGATTTGLNQVTAKKTSTPSHLHTQQFSTLKEPFSDNRAKASATDNLLSILESFQANISSKSHQKRQLVRQCHVYCRDSEEFCCIEGTKREEVPLFTTGAGKPPQEDCSGPDFSSFLPNERSPPSSTLFVKVTSCRRWCSCNPTSFFAEPNFISTQPERDWAKMADGEGDNHGTTVNNMQAALFAGQQKAHEREFHRPTNFSFGGCSFFDFQNRFNRFQRHDSVQSLGDVALLGPDFNLPQAFFAAPQEQQPPSLSLLLLPQAPNDDDVSAIVARTILNHSFFKQFAGVCSYVPHTKCSGFVHFERPGDALQCLRWLLQQESLRPWVVVGFARQDTRAHRLCKRQGR